MSGPEETPSFHTLPEKMAAEVRPLVGVIGEALQGYCRDHPEITSIHITSAFGMLYAMAWADVAVSARLEFLLPKALRELEVVIRQQIRALQKERDRE
jgi:hypothetical protein